MKSLRKQAFNLRYGTNAATDLNVRISVEPLKVMLYMFEFVDKLFQFSVVGMGC